MIHITQKKQNEGAGSMVAAAVAGAVVGAGVVAAGAMALKDEKNREKVRDAFNTAKDQAKKHMDYLHKEAQNKKDDVDDAVADGKKKVEKVSEEVRDTFNTEVKETKRPLHIK